MSLCNSKCVFVAGCWWQCFDIDFAIINSIWLLLFFVGLGAGVDDQLVLVLCCLQWTSNIYQLATARMQIAAREIVLWTTPSEPPKALQASECSELLDPMRASCLILAQHQPGKFRKAVGT